MSKYQLWGYDVQGDEQGSYSVNDRYKVRVIELPRNATDEQVLKALKAVGYLKPGVKLSEVKFDDMGAGDGSVITFDEEETGYPLGELSLLEENPTPRRKVDVTAGKMFFSSTLTHPFMSLGTMGDKIIYVDDTGKHYMVLSHFISGVNAGRIVPASVVKKIPAAGGFTFELLKTSDGRKTVTIMNGTKPMGFLIGNGRNVGVINAGGHIPMAVLNKVGEFEKYISVKENPLTRKESARLIKETERMVVAADRKKNRQFGLGAITASTKALHLFAPAGVNTARVSYHLHRRLKNPPSSFKNVGEFKDYLEYTLIPNLKAAGYNATAGDFEDLLKLLKARIFNKPMVDYLKGVIRDLHTEGEKEDLASARDLSTGIKFLYDVTDGGKRTGHKNPYEVHNEEDELPRKVIDEVRKSLALLAKNGKATNRLLKTMFENVLAEGDMDRFTMKLGEAIKIAKRVDRASVERLTYIRHIIALERPELIDNPLTSAERKRILKVADEHDRDASEHAKFEHKRLLPPGKLDPRSFRVKRIGGGKELIIGCPKGQYDAGTGVCRVGTKAQALLTRKNPRGVYDRFRVGQRVIMSDLKGIDSRKLGTVSPVTETMRKELWPRSQRPGDIPVVFDDGGETFVYSGFLLPVRSPDLKGQLTVEQYGQAIKRGDIYSAVWK